MAFMDSAFMGSWVSLLKGSSCLVFVGAQGRRAPGRIVRHRAAGLGGGFFAWIKVFAVHEPKFCGLSTKSHSDAFRLFRNPSEPFAYRARISCAFFRDAGQGGAMGLAALFGVQLALAGISRVFRKSRNPSEPVRFDLHGG